MGLDGTKPGQEVDGRAWTTIGGTNGREMLLALGFVISVSSIRRDTGAAATSRSGRSSRQDD